jgi:hypothetical protein
MPPEGLGRLVSLLSWLSFSGRGHFSSNKYPGFSINSCRKRPDFSPSFKGTEHSIWPPGPTELEIAAEVLPGYSLQEAYEIHCGLVRALIEFDRDADAELSRHAILSRMRTTEKATLLSQRGLYLCRQRPTLPHTFACSTIGPAGLNFRVRYGNGWIPRGKITDNLIARGARESC